MHAMQRKNILQAVKFTLFSISAGLVQVASFAFFHDVLHFSQYWFSYLPSLVLSVLWNFTFNRRFTFHSSANVGRSMLLVALYYLVFTPLSSWWGQLLSNAGVHDWLVEAINMLINFVTEFIYQKFVVFRDALDKKEEEREEAGKEEQGA